MNSNLRRFAVAGLIALVVSLPAVVSTQTVLSSTTLSSAITDASATSMVVASATGFTAPGTGAGTVYALIDKEMVRVRAVSGTSISIERGFGSTRAATHVSGAVVWVGPPAAYNSYTPSGQCTRTTLPYVPWIVAGGPGLGAETGTLYDCLGVTSAGQWVQTAPSLGVQIVGSTVASAGTITATGTYFAVSGTAAIATINVPAGWSGGNCLILEPTGIFTTTTGGNISLASTAVVGKALTECWNNLTSKWQPSY